MGNKYIKICFGIWSAICLIALGSVFYLEIQSKSGAYDAQMIVKNQLEKSPEDFAKISLLTPPPKAFYKYDIKLKFYTNIFRPQAPNILLTPISNPIDTIAAHIDKSEILSLENHNRAHHYTLITTKKLTQGDMLGVLDYAIEVRWKSICMQILSIYIFPILLALLYFGLLKLESRRLFPFSKISESKPIVPFAQNYPNTKILLCMCGVIFVCGLFMRFYYANQKEILFVDEAWSIAIASSSKGCMALSNDGCQDKIYYDEFGKTIKEQELWRDKSFASAFIDIKNLYLTNNGDAHAHTNLYYTLFRLWNIGVQTGDLQWIMQRGIGLNIAFYCLSFLFGFLFVRKLIGFNYLVPLFLGVVFLNGASVSNTLFMREYALQECLLLAFCLMLSLFYFNQKNSFKFLGLFVLVTSLLLLSGYFMIVFVALCFGIIGFLTLREHKPSKFKVLCCVGVVALVGCELLFPLYSRGFFGGHAHSATSKVSNATFSNLTNSLDAYIEILHVHLFNFITLIVLFMLFVFKPFIKDKAFMQSKNAVMFLVLIVVGFAFGIVIIYLAPWKMLRYVVASLPLVGLVVVLVFVPYLAKKYTKIGISAGVVLLGGLIYYQEIGFLKFPEPRMYGMEFVLQEKDDIEIPTIYNVRSSYLACHIIPYFSDFRKYYFIDNVDDAIKKVKEFKQVYLITQYPIPEQELQILSKKDIFIDSRIYLIQN